MASRGPRWPASLNLLSVRKRLAASVHHGLFDSESRPMNATQSLQTGLDSKAQGRGRARVTSQTLRTLIRFTRLAHLLASSIITSLAAPIEVALHDPLHASFSPAAVARPVARRQ